MSQRGDGLEETYEQREARKLREARTFWVRLLTKASLVLVVCICLGMYGCPQYSVWEQGLVGEAELRRAEMNRQIAIQEAKAKEESAKHLAVAEVERARGVAAANKIIGDSLRDNEAYLRYLWIQGLQDGSSEVIYVPTEANLPILEATRKMPVVNEKAPTRRK